MPMPVFQYQDDGASWMAGRERAGLHDEMGVGKTATTIKAINKIGGRRGMIICPAMLRQNWITEFRKFSDYDLRLCKGQNIHDFVAWSRDRFDVLITSYELATKWHPRIMEQGEFLDFMALDEAHFLKNVNTSRTRAILGQDAGGYDGVTSWAQHAWHLTGTPMPNDPVDIYTFLKFVDAMPLTLSQFTKRYFTIRQMTYGTRQSPKPEMVPELKALIENNAIRRTKKEVGLQLPPIFMTSTVVDGDTDNVRQMLAEYPGLERSIVSALEQGGLSFLDAQYISTLRRLIGEAKAIPYAYMLHDELTYGGADKRVVFGIHKYALMTVRDILAVNGHHVVVVNGDTPERDRQAAVSSFQENPDCRVFIGNIRAAGTGLTLTAACEIDMLESDWTPAGNAQAIMRVHRIGQVRNVRARFISLANTLDEVVNRVVADKTASIAEVEGEAMHATPLDI
ncbi:DEAD/DEAH box helicase [Tepidimonas sp.]|uniref:DEAD/DEAH box helicase n=1 Tax=Tepidimonas sp. TaxID=2002775 RepID=UPI00391A6897